MRVDISDPMAKVERFVQPLNLLHCYLHVQGGKMRNAAKGGRMRIRTGPNVTTHAQDMHLPARFNTHAHKCYFNYNIFVRMRRSTVFGGKRIFLCTTFSDALVWRSGDLVPIKEPSAGWIKS